MSLDYGDLLRVSENGRYDYATLCDVFGDQVLVELVKEKQALLVVNRRNIAKVKPAPGIH